MSKLRDLRSTRGSLKWMAGGTGISRSRLSRIEHGELMPTNEELNRISSILQLQRSQKEELINSFPKEQLEKSAMSKLRAGVYRHYKGRYYQVLGMAQHTETKELLVLYVTLYVQTGPRFRVRPLLQFFQEVEYRGKMVPRYQYIGLEMP